MDLKGWVERVIEVSDLTEEQAWRVLGDTGILDILSKFENMSQELEVSNARREEYRVRKQRQRESQRQSPGQSSGQSQDVSRDPPVLLSTTSVPEVDLVEDKKPQKRYDSTVPAVTPQFYDQMLSDLEPAGLTTAMLDAFLTESEAVFRAKKTQRTMAGLRKWTISFVTNKLNSRSQKNAQHQ